MNSFKNTVFTALINAPHLLRSYKMRYMKTPSDWSTPSTTTNPLLRTHLSHIERPDSRLILSVFVPDGMTQISLDQPRKRHFLFQEDYLGRKDVLRS